MEQWRSQVPELLQAVPLILAPLPPPAAEMQLRVLLRGDPPALVVGQVEVQHVDAERRRAV